MSGPVVHVDDEEEEQEFSVIGNEKALSNGDIYLGSWLANLPDGIGKYLWADGCMYEGEWYKGRKSGNGKFSWPSGATYEGEFKGGFMDGYGTYTGINGSTYRGYWAMNEKHGYGQKSFANGDFYDGSWRHGVQDGQGRYVWKNGNEYVGEWKGGLMCGKGILTWASGNKYDGHWLDGFEHGHGTYTWADGSYFVGTWNKDLKDANGTFYPNSNRSSNNPPSSSGDLQEGFAGNQNGSSLPDNKLFVNSSYMLSCKTIGHNPLVRNTSHRVPPKNVSVDASKRPTAEKPFDRICIWDSGNNEADATCDAVDLGHERSGSSILDNSAVFSMVERGFNGGVLVDELDKENVTSKALKVRQNWHLKETKRPGETIFKGHRNYDLMLNLQLGIRYTVGRVTPEPAREICPADFGPKARIWMRFPPEGSKFTPPHQSADFKWKDYCPMVFRHLRELFKIDAADYMLSICGNDALRELSSPGKSGSVFYLSHDDRFMIKTMRKSEVKVLLGMLPNYYNHVCTYEGTLITKFFGLHSVKAGGQKVRFIVMGNLLCSELHIHRRFDLKGSSQGRSTGKVEINETTTLKDLDLDFVFRLQPFWCNALLKQIERDCEFLESQRIMDYSLLLGLHFRAPQHPTIISPGPSTELHVPEDAVYATPSCKGVLEGKWNSTRGPVLVARKYDQNWDLAVSRGDPSNATEVDEVDLFLPGTARKLRIQPGVNMPARAERRLPSRESDSDPEGELFCEVYDVVLYFGIIDILQDYDITKRLEHAYKSLQFSSLSISAVDPKLYAKRFQDFIQRIFIKEP